MYLIKIRNTTSAVAPLVSLRDRLRQALTRCLRFFHPVFSKTPATQTVNGSNVRNTSWTLLYLRVHTSQFRNISTYVYWDLFFCFCFYYTLLWENFEYRRFWTSYWRFEFIDTVDVRISVLETRLNPSLRTAIPTTDRWEQNRKNKTPKINKNDREKTVSADDRRYDERKKGTSDGFDRSLVPSGW